jgi:hypothetical protein
MSYNGNHLGFLIDTRNKQFVKGHPSNSLLLNGSVNPEKNDTKKYFFLRFQTNFVL